jgi:predicted phosphoribosyltransferase
LASQLISLIKPDANVLVLGLARGGVLVAAEVAAALKSQLDVLIVRKLGVPARPELAMGAIAVVGDTVQVVRNEALTARFPVRDEAFDAAYRRETTEAQRQQVAYLQDRVPVQIRDRVVVIIDDGLATGATMKAAIVAVRRERPAHIIAAVPVGSFSAVEALRSEAHELICAWTPEPFYAVGAAYYDFSPTGDDQVRAALADAVRMVAR